MKQSLLILIASIFLIGNYHVVTDWCSDLEKSGYETTEQVAQSHDSAKDLCGHCGHLGLNILLLESPQIFTLEFSTNSKPIVGGVTLVSLLLPPPTPPPVIFS